MNLLAYYRGKLQTTGDFGLFVMKVDNKSFNSVRMIWQSFGNRWYNLPSNFNKIDHFMSHCNKIER